MLIRFGCPDCRARLGVPDADAGQVVECPRCGCRIEAPEPKADQEPVRAEAIRDDDRPRFRPRRRPRPRADYTPAIVIGVLVVVGVAVAAVVLGRRPNQPRETATPPPPGLGNVFGIAAGGPGLPGKPARPPLPPGWVEFRHPEGVYSVYLPGHAIRNKDTTPGGLLAPVPAGRMHMSIYEAASPDYDLRCEVWLANLSPDGVGIWGTEEITWNSLPGTNKTRSTVTWSGHRCSEFVYRPTLLPDPNALQVRRHMCIGTRVYSAIIGRRSGPPTDAERAAFFDSFVIER